MKPTQNTIALVGVGKMGARLAIRWVEAGFKVIAIDPNVSVSDLQKIVEQELEGERARNALAAIEQDFEIIPWAGDLETQRELVFRLERPRTIWTMLHHELTGPLVENLAELLASGDRLLDGSNSRHTESQRRAALLAQHGIDAVDVGTSGGIHGLKRGYSLMIGGKERVVSELAPVFEALAPEPAAPGMRHWGRVGDEGAGHLAKCVHNGIEYGQMAALAEGLNILDQKGIDLLKVTQIWLRGSVVQSWLLELTAEGLAIQPGLEGISAKVADTGEGRWTVQEAVELGVPAPVITAALFSRFESRGNGEPANRLLSLMRNGFGGHKVSEN